MAPEVLDVLTPNGQMVQPRPALSAERLSNQMFNFSFKTKLIFSVAALLIALQSINYWSISTLTKERIIENANSDIAAARILIEDLINMQAINSANMSAVTIGDTDLGPKMTGEIEGTRLAAVEQARFRTRADVAAFINFDGVIDTSTSREALPRGRLFEHPKLLELAEANNSGFSFGIGWLGEKLYVLNMVAVYTSRTPGFFVAARLIDDSFMSRLMSKLPKTVKATIGPRSDLAELAARVDPADVGKLPLQSDAPQMVVNTPIKIDGASQMINFTALPAASPEEPIDLVLSISIDQAMAQSQPMFSSLTYLLIGSLSIAVIMSIIFAKSLSRPIEHLTNLASDVENGVYDHLPLIQRRDEIGRLTAAFSTMVTRVKNREAKLLFQARHDKETGLLNRETLIAELDDDDFKQGMTAGIIALKVQTLTDVNHVFGRTIGQETTTTIADRLSAHAPADALVARVDETNFIVSVFTSNITDLMATAKKLARMVEKPVRIADSALGLNVKVAVALDTQCQSAATLCQMADAALYRSDSSTSEVVAYDPALDEPNTDLFTLMADVTEALKNGEFQLFLQPKINLKTGAITGAEALVRWFHKKRGLIRPDQFIPLAERTGKIRLITDWIIEEAAIIAKQLRAQDLTCAIGVNLSVHDLHDHRLPKIINRIIAQHGLEQNDLHFEITENELMADPQKAIAVLDDLRDQGLQLAVDDFGTGYSSLEYLRRLPVTEIKIDRSFIKELSTSESDQVITRAAIDMGHGLGMTVTAEGVEDLQTACILRNMGCETAQGFYFSKPMPRDDFFALAADWTCDFEALEARMNQSKSGLFAP